MSNLHQKAETLLEALPFIRRFSGKFVVIKYGGHAMQEDDLRQAFAQDVVLLKYVGMYPVVVHGGGPQIERMLARLKIQSSFLRGMRITDAPTMEVVEMVLNRINKQLVSLINRQGNLAVGVTGQDGELVAARKMRLEREGLETEGKRDLGSVGEIVGVNPSVIRALTEQDMIPVIAPIGYGFQGETYNINADLVAGKIAEALRAEKLIFLTDVPGIKDREGNLMSTITSIQAEEMVGDGTISAGMIPKVECCLAALHGGAHKVHILDGRTRHSVLLEILTREGIGTEVVRRIA